MFIRPVCNSLHLSYLCFFFNWKIIALQCCIGFCHTSAGISHKYTYVPSPLNLPPTSHHILPFPLHCHKRTGYELCGHTANPHWLSSSRPGIFMFVLVSQCVSSPPPLLCPQVCSLSAFPLLPCIELHPYHLSRSRVYMCVNTYLFFSFHWAFLKHPHYL